jgi:hypothetical protein
MIELPDRQGAVEAVSLIGVCVFVSGTDNVVVSLRPDMGNTAVPIDDRSQRAKPWTYAIYTALAVIAVLFWFAYGSDSSVAAGGDPAGNGMSRAFNQLICIATGIVSLIVAAIALRVTIPEIKAILLVLLVLLAIFMGVLM